MRAHRGGIERMSALGGDFLGTEGLRLRGSMRQLEDHEVEYRGEGRIIEAREIRHLGVEMRLPDTDLAEHPVKERHGELAAPLRNRRVTGGIAGDRWGEPRNAGAGRSVADRAIGLKGRGPLGR